MNNKIVYNYLTSLVIFIIVLALDSSAQAQSLVVGAEQVKNQLAEGKKVMLIDARTADEYREGHIPGAENIQPDSIKASAKRLPKDKSTPIIFYCRGAG